MSTPSLSDLTVLFEQRVKQDKVDFGINSVYLPNPTISQKPRFCLVAMEPSVKAGGIEKTKQRISLGLQNFLMSEEDFILHYCAYKYLCGETFSYYITDISKGAMATQIASYNRNKRYEKWGTLLQTELKVLGNPIVIAVGKSVEKSLRDSKIPIKSAVMHYSWSNSRWIKHAYKYDKNPYSLESLRGIEQIIFHFSQRLFDHIRYPFELREERLKVIFQKPLPEWKKCLLLVYRVHFEGIAGRRE